MLPYSHVVGISIVNDGVLTSWHILILNHWLEEKAQYLDLLKNSTKVVRKRRFPMIFHNEKHVYWH
jgi:hypothetical protein